MTIDFDPIQGRTQVEEPELQELDLRADEFPLPELNGLILSEANELTPEELLKKLKEQAMLLGPGYEQEVSRRELELEKNITQLKDAISTVLAPDGEPLTKELISDRLSKMEPATLDHLIDSLCDDPAQAQALKDLIKDGDSSALSSLSGKILEALKDGKINDVIGIADALANDSGTSAELKERLKGLVAASIDQIKQLRGLYVDQDERIILIAAASDGSEFDGQGPGYHPPTSSDPERTPKPFGKLYESSAKVKFTDLAEDETSQTDQESDGELDRGKVERILNRKKDAFNSVGSKISTLEAAKHGDGFARSYGPGEIDALNRELSNLEREIEELEEVLG